MRAYIKSATATALEDDNMPINFACCGRQQYRGAGGGLPSGLKVVPYQVPGPTRNDWSWKPSPDTQASIARGSRKCAPPAFDEYLATLSNDERRRVLTNKHEFENGHFAAQRRRQIEDTFADQMEGYTDDASSE